MNSGPIQLASADRSNVEARRAPGTRRATGYPKNGAGFPDSAYSLSAPTIRPHV